MDSNDRNRTGGCQESTSCITKRAFILKLKPSVNKYQNLIFITGIGPFLEVLSLEDFSSSKKNTSSGKRVRVFQDHHIPTEDGLARGLDSYVRGGEQLKGADFIVVWSHDQFSVLGLEDLINDDETICVRRTARFPVDKKVVRVFLRKNHEMFVVYTKSIDIILLKLTKGRLDYTVQETIPVAKGNRVICAQLQLNINGDSGKIFCGMSNGLLNIVNLTTGKIHPVGGFPKAPIKQIRQYLGNMVLLCSDKLCLISFSGSLLQSMDNKGIIDFQVNEDGWDEYGVLGYDNESNVSVWSGTDRLFFIRQGKATSDISCLSSIQLALNAGLYIAPYLLVGTDSGSLVLLSFYGIFYEQLSTPIEVMEASPDLHLFSWRNGDQKVTYSSDGTVCVERRVAEHMLRLKEEAFRNADKIIASRSGDFMPILLLVNTLEEFCVYIRLDQITFLRDSSASWQIVPLYFYDWVGLMGFHMIAYNSAKELLVLHAFIGITSCQYKVSLDTKKPIIAEEVSRQGCNIFIVANGMEIFWIEYEILDFSNLRRNFDFLDNPKRMKKLQWYIFPDEKATHIVDILFLKMEQHLTRELVVMTNHGTIHTFKMALVVADGHVNAEFIQLQKVEPPVDSIQFCFLSESFGLFEEYLNRSSDSFEHFHGVYLAKTTNKELSRFLVYKHSTSISICLADEHVRINSDNVTTGNFIFCAEGGGVFSINIAKREKSMRKMIRLRSLNLLVHYSCAFTDVDSAAVQTFSERFTFVFVFADNGGYLFVLDMKTNSLSRIWFLPNLKGCTNPKLLLTTDMEKQKCFLVATNQESIIICETCFAIINPEDEKNLYFHAFLAKLRSIPKPANVTKFDYSELVMDQSDSLLNSYAQSMHFTFLHLMGAEQFQTFSVFRLSALNMIRLYRIQNECGELLKSGSCCFNYFGKIGFHRFFSIYEHSTSTLKFVIDFAINSPLLHEKFEASLNVDTLLGQSDICINSMGDCVNFIAENSGALRMLFINFPLSNHTVNIFSGDICVEKSDSQDKYEFEILKRDFGNSIELDVYRHQRGDNFVRRFRILIDCTLSDADKPKPMIKSTPERRLYVNAEKCINEHRQLKYRPIKGGIIVYEAGLQVVKWCSEFAEEKPEIPVAMELKANVEGSVHVDY